MNPSEIKKNIDDIQKQVEALSDRLDEFSRSNSIPRSVETALTERLSSSFIVSQTKGADMGTTSFTDVGTTFNQTILNTNFTTASTQLNAIRTVLRSFGLML